MEEQPRRRWWLWLIPLTLMLICTLACFVLFLLPLPAPKPSITPAMQQSAEAALLNPEQSPIDLPGSASGWYPPRASDYAVEDGMVIFPQLQSRRHIIDWDRIYRTVTDAYMPALVYAPDGRTLRSENTPPVERDWYYVTEWFLYGCKPVEGADFWWSCTLLVGGNL